MIRDEEAHFLSVITIHQRKVGDAINASFSSVMVVNIWGFH